MLNVAILGASGFTGFECIRLLQHHSDVVISHLFSLRDTNESLVNFTGNNVSFNTTIEHFDPLKNYDIDCLLIALPHTIVHEFMPELIKHTYRIIDLSADFRLNSSDRYRLYYGMDHACESLLSEAVYGLNEYYATKIAQADLVANPGCYAIATILGLKPLTDLGMINHVVVDAKSGVSGAGKALKESNLYANANEHISAYNTNKHRHMAEFEENCPCSMIFSPHLVPMNRGILVSAYLQLSSNQTKESLEQIFQTCYENAPFVSISSTNTTPSTQDVIGTNRATISLLNVEKSQAIITVAIDNLIKGAAGNAIQTMNVMFGLPEVSGLPLIAQRV